MPEVAIAETTANRILPKNYLPWMESLKAIAILWIIGNHICERLFGWPFFGNPDAHWPALTVRFAQMRPLQSPGFWHWPLTCLRDIGWFGDQGVSIFLILSGIGLTWGLLAQSASQQIDWSRFYRRRFGRIFPIWWMAHILILLPFAVLGYRLSLLDSQFYFSLVGVRVLPDQLYYGVPAWWFVTLLLQLYLVFPFLFRLLQRFGPLRFFFLCAGTALLLRAGGLYVFHDYLDAWSRGAIFISRLPEFAFGMVMAVWLSQTRSGTNQKSASSSFWIGAVLFLPGAAGSFTLAGMVIAPLFQGVGAFLFFYAMLRAQRFHPLLNWIGRHSLSLFLVHQVFTQTLLPRFGQAYSLTRVILGLLLVILFTTLGALVLEKATQIAQLAVAAGAARWGTQDFLFRTAGVFLAVWAILIGSECAVRAADPQEAWDLGWGERPALQPDPLFGWKLRPSRQTRLRWQSYDYRVEANSLGFAGPEPPNPEAKRGATILITGDAFSSAEGVDTRLSWPRLLEQQLNHDAPNSSTHVLNFAITGYGPNQYRAVISKFAPLYHPDLILLGLFINDYDDVLISDDDFRTDIGFGKPDPNGWAAVLTFRQFSAYLRKAATKLVAERVLKKPDPQLYFWGQVHMLRTGPGSLVTQGRNALQKQLSSIKQSADNAGSRLMIVMIPAAPQVCSSDLKYDPSQYDFNLPQQTTREIAQQLSVPVLDLRPALRKPNVCVYQPRNMHWTAEGHALTARYVAQQIECNNYLRKN